MANRTTTSKLGQRNAWAGLEDLAEKLGEKHGYPRTRVFRSASVAGGFGVFFDAPNWKKQPTKGAAAKILAGLKRAGWVPADPDRDPNVGTSLSILPTSTVSWIVKPKAGNRAASCKQVRFTRRNGTRVNFKACK